jgi:hypothetical protein
MLMWDADPGSSRARRRHRGPHPDPTRVGRAPPRPALPSCLPDLTWRSPGASKPPISGADVGRNHQWSDRPLRPERPPSGRCPASVARLMSAACRPRRSVWPTTGCQPPARTRGSACGSHPGHGNSCGARPDAVLEAAAAQVTATSKRGEHDRRLPGRAIPAACPGRSGGHVRQRRRDGCRSIRCPAAPRNRGRCPDRTVHRGHCRSLRMSAARGSGRRAGVRWWDAATASKRSGAGG